MASQYLDAIRKLNNGELINLLKSNGYGGFEEVLQNNEITGLAILNLTEFEVIRWKLPSTEKRQLWSCVTELQKNPHKFFKAVKPKSKANLPTSKKPDSITRQTDILKKLELVIGQNKPFESRTPKKPETKVDPPTPPVEEYLPMDNKKPSFPDTEDDYDGDGYLTPIAQKENAYEPPPTIKPTNFDSRRQKESQTQISQRAPLALPRPNTDDRGYILGPRPQRTDYYNSEPPPPPPPIVSRNPNKHFTSTRKAKEVLPSPVSASDETDEEGLVYEPAPDVGISHNGNSFVRYENSSPVPSVESPDASETGALSKKLLGLFKNSLAGKLSTSSTKIVSRDKSPIESPKGLKRNLSFNRPLPPTPNSPPATDEEEGQVYENIKDEHKLTNRKRSPSPDDQLYENNEIVHPPPKLPTGHRSNKPASRSKSETVTVAVPPLKQPGGYEHHVIKSEDKDVKKKLPAPPSSLPKMPLVFSPHTLHTNGDDDDENAEYNNYISNINNEPFYRNTDRKGAKELLEGFPDGAFLFRPSKKFFLTLSLNYHATLINLGVEKTENNRIRLNTDGDNLSPEYATITEFIERFTREYLTFQYEGKIAEVRLRKLLPPNRF